MIWILLAIAMGALGIGIVKLRVSEKSKIRKKLVKELRYSGKLEKDVNLLYSDIREKNKKIRESKERSIKLVEQFVRMNAEK